MKREICRDLKILSKKSNMAKIGDEKVAIDLIDTLKAHKDGCLGMAANMIGENKRIIAVYAGVLIITMMNPVIIDKSEPYQAVEGCLSIDGQKETTRYKKITVQYEDSRFNKVTHSFSGVTAQAIQHEIDHLNGVLI